MGREGDDQQDSSQPFPAGPEGPSVPLSQPESGQPSASVLPQVQWTEPSATTIPAAPVLREMGLGEILDASIKMYRKRWKTFIAIVAVLQIPFIFVQNFITFQIAPPENPFDAFREASQNPETFQTPPATPLDFSLGPILAGGIFFLVYLLFITPLLTGAVAHTAAESYLGRETTPGQAYGFALKKIPSILLVSIITGLAIIGGVVLLLIGAVFFWIKLVFGTLSVVVEGKSGGQAVGRSWDLTKGHWWRIFGILILTSILVGIVGGIIGAPFSIGAFFGGSFSWVLASIGQSIGQVITVPFTAIVLVHLYFDLRIRKEAFDIQVLAQELESQAT